MPSRSSKNVHGRMSKNTPARNKQESVPVTPVIFAPPPPVVTGATIMNEQEPEQASGQLVDIQEPLSPIQATPASIPFFEDEEDAIVPVDDEPPIPIPVPRSQTPQFVSSQAYDFTALTDTEQAFEQAEPLFGDQHDRLIADSHTSPAVVPNVSRLHVDDPSGFKQRSPQTLSISPPPSSPPIAPTVAPPTLGDEPSSYSYAYGYGHGQTSPRSSRTHSHHKARSPSPSRSGLSRTRGTATGTSTSMGGTSAVGGQAPTTALTLTPTTPAVPVVDLGTAGTVRPSSSHHGEGVRSTAPLHPHSHPQARNVSKGTTQNERGALWARWDECFLHDGARVKGQGKNHRPTRLLIVGYPSTLRMWDTTDLENITEILRLPLVELDVGEGDGVELVHAAVLPGSSGEARPWIGLAFNTGKFIVYSLRTHRIVTRFQVGQAELPPPARGGGEWKHEAIGASGARIESFEASREVIVISTTAPPSLHIYHATSFEPLLEIPDAKLYLYAPPPFTQLQVSEGVQGLQSAREMLSSAVRNAVGGAVGALQAANAAANANFNNGRRFDDTNAMYDTKGRYIRDNHNIKTDTNYSNNTYTNNNNYNDNPVFLSSSSSPSSPLPPGLPPPRPRPVYALSHRLLAYVSCTPSSHTSRSPESPSSSSRPFAASPTTMTMTTATTPASPAQAAARSVWGGMRALGGFAVSAARSRMGTVDGAPNAGMGAGAGVGRFFSRSAPEERGSSGAGRERIEGMGEAGDFGRAEGGGWVRVIDLGPILDVGGDEKGGRGDENGVEVGIVEFSLDKDKDRAHALPIARLAFLKDGTSLGVVPRDGHGVKVYQIRPCPSALCARSEKTIASGEGAAWEVYTLRRGRTGAIVDGLAWSGDGQWAALGTRKGTVHVFAPNPYGGRTDVKSHWEGRVRNIDDLSQVPMEMSPLARLRATVLPIGSVRPPLAFTFIDQSQTPTPAHLLPPPPPPISSSPSHYAQPRSYSSTHTDTSTPSHSPSHRLAHFVDVLMFDPADSSLALRRVVLEVRPRDQLGLGAMGMGIVGGALGGGVTSISLPGMGLAGALSLSASPSSGGGSGGGGGPFGHRAKPQVQTAQHQQQEMELVARESMVKTWSLGPSIGAGEVRKIMGIEDEGIKGIVEGKGERQSGRVDWLAQAELSTCSKSSRVLPRPIYLSHQFSFHTLGEDYHALIRRYQLDIVGFKIDVRREVQVSAYAAGRGGESFVEGFPSSPRDIRHHRTLSSSFDEPLASALTNELDHSHAPGVLPMLPNGPSRSQGTFRAAIPIRTIGDGMTESLGRLRREINSRVRSPRLRPRPDSGLGAGVPASVPLEFDEEDEDFMGAMEIDGGLRVPIDKAQASSSRETSMGSGDSGASAMVSTPATSVSEEEVLEGEEMWGGWSAKDKAALEEHERFDNIDVLGLLDEEQTPGIGQPLAKPREGKRRGRGRRRE